VFIRQDECSIVRMEFSGSDGSSKEAAQAWRNPYMSISLALTAKNGSSSAIAAVRKGTLMSLTLKA